MITLFSGHKAIDRWHQTGKQNTQILKAASLFIEKELHEFSILA